jgi:hypothetical protein
MAHVVGECRFSGTATSGRRVGLCVRHRGQHRSSLLFPDVALAGREFARWLRGGYSGSGSWMFGSGCSEGFSGGRRSFVGGLGQPSGQVYVSVVPQ